jgi:hypothetical protein
LLPPFGWFGHSHLAKEGSQAMTTLFFFFFLFLCFIYVVFSFFFFQVYRSTFVLLEWIVLVFLLALRDIENFLVVVEIYCPIESLDG